MIDSNDLELINKKYYRTFIKYIFFSISFYIVALFVVTYILETKNIDLFNKKTNNQVERSIAHVIKAYDIRLSNIAETSVLNIKNKIASKDHDFLIKNFDNYFKELKHEMPTLESMQFIDVNGSSIARLHETNAYSDNLLEKRDSIKNITQNHLKIIGYENGVYKNVFRFMYPIFENGYYIGALEFGFSPFFLLDEISDITGYCSMFYMDKGRTLEVDSNSKNRLSKDKIEKIKSIAINYDMNSLSTISFEDKEYLVSPVKIRDFNKKTVGYVFVLIDTSKLTNNKTTLLQLVGGMSTIMFVLLILFVSKIFKKMQYKIVQVRQNQVEDLEEYKNKLELSNNYLDTVFNFSPSMIYTTNGEALGKINNKLLEFLNYDSVEELVCEHECICEFFENRDGFVAKEVDGTTWLEYILKHKDLKNRVLMKNRKTLKEHVFDIKIEKLNFDKNQRHIVALNDITELEFQKNRFEEAIDGTQDGLWDWNLSTDEVYYSTRWKSMLGYEPYELANKLSTWKKLVHPVDYEEASQDLEKNINKQSDYYENIHRLKHKDGSWVWILDRGKTVFDVDGHPLRMVGFITDITEKKLLEEKLIKKDEMMIAQSQNAAMGEMISMIAHQWRQPIAIISMSVNNMLVDIELDEIEVNSFKEHSETILTQTQHLSQTIDDFRNFFKPEKVKSLVTVQSVIDNLVHI
ncbi:MAG: PAS domain-containing protein [Campylobacterota bacterium]|nr:PAS domain-containing protein [Campylobacterota bacterium]